MDGKVDVTREALQGIANNIIELIMKKNHDYGNSWQRYGVFTSLIRLNDKLLRVATLQGKQALVADESIEDTMKDIVAYGLLCLLRLNWEKLFKLMDEVGDEELNPNDVSDTWSN